MTSPHDIVNILMVDDEPRNLLALQAVLEGSGRNLVKAHSGVEALRQLLRHDFAVVLLDVHMPEMDGFETARLIRDLDRTRHIPIIFLTAANKDRIHVEHGYALGAVDYMFKPFDADILRSKVAVFVELFRKNLQLARQAEEIAEATGLLQSVLHSTLDYALIAQDLDGTIMAWYEGARRLYGYESSDVTGRSTVAPLFAEPDAASRDELYARALRRGAAEGVFQHVRQNGTQFTASVNVTVRRDASGDPIGFVTVCKDVTEQRAQEEQARLLIREQAARSEAEAAHARFEFLADVTAESARLVSDPGSLERVARRMLGYFADGAAFHLLERNGDLKRAVLVHRDRASAARLQSLTVPAPDAPCRVARVLRSGRHAFYGAVSAKTIRELADTPEDRALLQDLRLKSAMIVPIPGAAGITGTITLYRFDPSEPYTEVDLDVALALGRRLGLALDNARLFADVREALVARDDFISSASHDLKTPLMVIRGRAQLLKRRTASLGPEGEQFAAALDAINHSTDRMVRLIDEMLDVAHLQAGHPLSLNRQPTDLVALARAAAGEFSQGGKHRDPRDIRVDAEEDSVLGTWDTARLERVVGNLLSNAMEYSPPHEQIAVRVGKEESQEGTWAVLSVQDHGVGIPEDDLPRVFERFFRGKNVAGKIAGTGIGLAGVKQIVEEHHGTIGLESKELVGTTVVVKLPLE